MTQDANDIDIRWSDGDAPVCQLPVLSQDHTFGAKLRNRKGATYILQSVYPVIAASSSLLAAGTARLAAGDIRVVGGVLLRHRETAVETQRDEGEKVLEFSRRRKK